MLSYLIRNAIIVNEGKLTQSDLLVRDGHIAKIAPLLDTKADCEIEAAGLYLLPGVIDDQVHFREPGLLHKASIATESRAAVAGGITSFMEMPNTIPATTTLDLLEDKYRIAAQRSLANYSFYLGATANNLDEIKRINPKTVCGLKIFMGSSTGDLLVADPEVLDKIFGQSPVLIATHCEDNATIARNLARIRAQNIDPDASFHPLIRDADSCYLSSSLAVSLAQKHRTRLHVLHISTEREIELFEPGAPGKKLITAEACIHHLWFCDQDYTQKGNLIKWNPAIKTAQDRQAIFHALLNDRIDVVATDHAPHTLEEKEQPYLLAPSGGPLVQHSLLAMLDFYLQGKITLPFIAQKMAHSVADCFAIEGRGYIREGYWADLVLVDTHRPTPVTRDSLYYKCRWSPFEGHTFGSQIIYTFVSGHLAYAKGKFDETVMGKRLKFDRPVA